MSALFPRRSKDLSMQHHHYALPIPRNLGAEIMDMGACLGFVYANHRAFALRIEQRYAGAVRCDDVPPTWEHLRVSREEIGALKDGARDAPLASEERRGRRSDVDPCLGPACGALREGDKIPGGKSA